MKSVTQKEGVFLAVCLVLKSINAVPKKGFIVKDEITKDMRLKVIQSVYQGLKDGSIDLKTEYTDKELGEYVPGMVSNHLRKDTRLNGGDKHKIINPGSMTGNKDPKIKETRKLIKQLKENNAPDKAIKKCEVLLESMVTEWKKKNGKVTEINGDHIPQELRELYEGTINKSA